MRACTECGGQLSEARDALGLESCSGPCNAARRRRLASVVVLCAITDTCTCGAPADMPSGMHHDHCAVNPARPDRSGCRVCKIPPTPPEDQS